MLAGVMETIFCGSAGIQTAVPSSSTTFAGYTAAGVGEAEGEAGDGAAVATAALGLVVAAGVADAAAPVHAPNRIAASATSTSNGRNGERVVDTRGASGWWKEREGREESRSPSLLVRREGLIRWIARSCLPFSRRFEQSTVGRRPDFRPREGGHRSGTVPESHRLRDHAAWVCFAPGA